MKKQQQNFGIAIGMLVLFVLWTVLIRLVDVQPIGPNGSAVGLATVNQFFHRLTGVHMSIYHITDWLGLIPIGFGMGFSALGLAQWIKRKSLLRVDFSILVLGGFYLVVLATYLFFETVIVNYRPILINGVLEASYPSSTTMLAMCIMPTTAMQLNDRIKNRTIRCLVVAATIAFMAFMVIARLVSGVHWLTDIIGGALLSAGLVMMYRSVSNRK